MFFRASGVRYRLPDGSSMKEWCRGWEGSSVMRVAFLITERLYSSVRGSWAVLVILLACFIMRESFVLVVVVRKLNQDETL